MKVSDYIIDFIEKKGTEYFFSLSWWMISNLEDSIFLNKKVKLISLKHEQAWAFAAEWYARSTWKTWIAMWTSWPWATNMITWIASSYYDWVPVIYITGQVNTNEITKNNVVRQTWFQEANIVSITKNITKFSYQIKKASEIKYILEKSFFIAHNWRKWPILIDIPMNIQKENIKTEDLISFFNSKEYQEINKNKEKLNTKSEQIISLVNKSKRPIFLLWWWLKYIKNNSTLIELIKILNIPVVSSLMWLDTIDNNLNNYIWMIGSYGNRESNIALINSDLVIVLGSRLDIRQTWADKDYFTKGKKIIQIDISENELWYNIKDNLIKINQDLSNFLEDFLIDTKKNLKLLPNTNWLEKIINIKKIILKNNKKREWTFHNPNYILETLSNIIKKPKIVINDVWQNQMISSLSFKLNKEDQIINSWWLWSMWFSLPSSIWAHLWNTDKLIISINWDGWFQMNIQELETINYYKLPILIIILNNNSLWMIREFQDSYFEWRNIWTVIWYSCPNLSKIAKAYQIDYLKIWKWNFKNTLEKAANINKPTILEILVSEKSSITKVMFWDSLDKQTPKLNKTTEKKINNILNK